ncbi:CGNR zinc finger domain-containing protein [Fibrella sp. HMF5335]|uniref:CGNR zinc finger domain-containing protein n=1 Tax=Fibrella rubiginis TaxID=2817060 RepID=A0A939GJJ7_9BACT|nr:CGNR zinc finger domain-containing protein [Fibrella rubiginis]MBO0938429.1 CGNR zinc finger domain-containing protein [Fibrella rubiginis]
MAKVSTIAEMDLTGGIACLDFINTALSDHLPVERLHSYSDLLVLSRRLSLLDTATLDTLELIANQNSAQAERVLLEARKVRQSMLGVFDALASGQLQQVTAQLLTSFNGSVHEALCERNFSVQGNELAMTLERSEKQLMQAVWSFSLSAYDLLTTRDQQLVKQCGACGWFFLDETKNHRRKWCDMQTCGTNQKARRYYQRKKLASLG